jgi:deoxyribose-phosphate aldolase
MEQTPVNSPSNVGGNESPLPETAPETVPSPSLSLDSNTLPLSPEIARLKLLAGIVADIDHTVLKQNASDADLKQLCDEALLAKKLLGVGPRSVCVNSADVSACATALAGSGILVCSVVGFPLGRMTTESKVFETRSAIAAGASEIDMVIHVGALKAGRTAYVENEIREIAAACHEKGALLKVIIETCNLTDAEKFVACQLSEKAGADFVKTSTGTEKAGASVTDVALMRGCVSSKVKVKAAGGMQTAEDAVAMRAAGADRFGTSGLLRKILAELGAQSSGVAEKSAY